MIVIVVEPGKEPYTKEIEAGYDSLCQEVGGDIQVVYPYEEMVGLICNEEGKNNGLPLNRALRDEEGNIYDIIAGTFLIAGLTDDNFASVDPELIPKFTQLFEHPEGFAIMNGELVSFRL